MADSTISWEMVEGRLTGVNQEWEKGMRGGECVLPNRALAVWSAVGYGREARIILLPYLDALNGIIRKMRSTFPWLRPPV